MPARPREPKPPKPWRREDGRYRSDDDRFTIESGGAGRWFLTDEGSLDELGLARTLGPYDTLDAAKDEAAGRRDHATEASPLADRIAAARERPVRHPAARRTEAARDTPAEDPAASAVAPRPAAPQRSRTPARTREPQPEPEPASWLDELGADDRDRATAARRAIEALEALGVDDADALVRRDVLGRQPAIAARLLGRTLARALRDRLDPATLVGDARSAMPGAMRALNDVPEDALAGYAAFVAARVLEVTLDVVASREKADDAGRTLPGWRLVERTAPSDAVDRTPRRLIVTPADVTER
jgi:hypothetical protein